MNQTRANWSKPSWRDYFQSVPDGDPSLVQEQVFEFLQSESGIWAGYNAFKSEIDFSQVYVKTQQKIQWVFPYIGNKAQRVMEFRHSFHFEKSPLGFMQPVANSPQVSLFEVKGILVPGLGFDRKGMRIGRGMGYYDRVLESFKGLKVGVCYESHFAESLPAEEFDIQMDVIVSEKGAQWFR